MLHCPQRHVRWRLYVSLFLCAAVCAFFLLSALLLSNPDNQDLSNQDSNRDSNKNNRLLTTASSGRRRAAAADVHQGGGVGGGAAWRVMPMLTQGQGRGVSLGLEPGPLYEQQQRKIDNSQSSNENARIDDGGDDQVGVELTSKQANRTIPFSSSHPLVTINHPISSPYT